MKQLWVVLFVFLYLTCLAVGDAHERIGDGEIREEVVNLKQPLISKGKEKDLSDSQPSITNPARKKIYDIESMIKRVNGNGPSLFSRDAYSHYHYPTVMVFQDFAELFQDGIIHREDKRVKFDDRMLEQYLIKVDKLSSQYLTWL